MLTPAPLAEDRHGRILAELAGMGLELARDLRERALAAETADEATRLTTAFHRIARGIRQTLALELKVARFREDLAREVAAREADEARRLAEAREPAVRHRRDAVAYQVERLIWSEHEGEFDEDEAGRLQLRLDEWLAVVCERPDFTEADEDELIIEACEALGLDPGRIYDFAAAAAEPDDADEAAPAGADSG